MKLRTVEEAHAPAIARGAKCLECPLYGAQRGPVMGELSPTAKLLVVGEAPGEHEVGFGHPFVGKSGQVLDDALAAGGVSRYTDMTRELTGEVSVTNTILCQPPIPMWDYVALAKHEGKASPIACCRPRLALDVAEHLRAVRARGPEARATIAPVGKQALEVVGPLLGIAVGHAVAPGMPRSSTMARQHGAPVLAPARGRVPAITLLPTYHPAFAMRKESRKWMPIIRADLTRAASLSTRNGIPDWREPAFILNPSPQRALDVIEALRTRAQGPVTVDIETDGIDPRVCAVRCVGLGAKIDGEEVIIVVPIRRMDGKLWPWRPEAMQQVARALGTLLDEVGLSGQTLAFDTSTLLASGMMANHEKTWRDTAVQHHDTNQSELKHDLGFMAARYFESPFHKEDADVDAFEGVSDAELHTYCAKDVLVEMRLGDRLDDEIARCGTGQQYEIDTTVLPIAREMGDSGLFMLQEKRYDLYRELTWERQRKLKSFRALVGAHPKRERWSGKKKGAPDINPRSVPQLREWMYDVSGLPPLLNTDGKEFDPDDPLQDPSTGEDAVLALIDRGVGPDLERALDELMEFRGVDKILGSTVGLGEVEKEEADYPGIPGGLLGRILHLADRGKTAGAILWEPGAKWGVPKTHPIMRIRWALHPVVTGRWSSQPNAQNWSERVVITCPECAGAAEGHAAQTCKRCWDEKEGYCKGIVILNTRSMIGAPPGHVIVGADMEQIELRIYAWIANDRLLLKAFKEGLDAHTLNYCAMLTSDASAQQRLYAQLMAKGKKDPVVREARNTAKRYVYLTLYGGEWERLFQTMSAERTPEGKKAFPGLRETDVQKWMSNWRRSHPETEAWQRSAVARWRARGFVATRLHKRKRFFLGGEDRNAMANHEIQGTAGDMMNEAVIELAKRLPFRKHSPVSGLRLQIHDYLGGYWPRKDAEAVGAVFEKVMHRQVGGMDFPIELKISESLDKQ